MERQTSRGRDGERGRPALIDGETDRERERDTDGWRDRQVKGDRQVDGETDMQRKRFLSV